ncbi:MFS transporter [Novosphingobium sp.]|uniref:MFS transporter n=1 Tax=Novosphingobium sp. TaxID=1874826 RepID=UPI003340F6F5
MTPDTQPTPDRSGAMSRGIVGLLALCLFINYLDRGNLATAAPLIKDQLGLTNTQIGALGSVFFLVYSPGHILAAWVIARINPYRTLALGLCIWSLATVLSGFATGFAMLMLLRVLLGLGESAGMPASSKLLAQHIPPEKLGSANAAIIAGIYLGPAAGTFLGSMIVAHLGWRPLFFVFGAASLLWLVPWWLATRHASAAAAEPTTWVEPGIGVLLRKRQMWGAAIGAFAGNYVWFLLISWLPLYLVKVQGFSLQEMGALAGLVYLLSAGLALIFGWLSDVWMRAGASSQRVRMTMVCAGSVIGIGSMLGCALGNAQVAIASLLIFPIANGLGGFNLYAIGQTLAGPRAAGKWIGVQNAIGSSSGIVAPILTGMIIDRTGSFSLAFVAAAVIGVVGLLAWIFLVRRVEPIDWVDAGQSYNPIARKA